MLVPRSSTWRSASGVLVDPAFIVVGGPIKARNLARHHPAQPVMFVVRNDILNLYVVTKLPVPAVEPPF